MKNWVLYFFAFLIVSAAIPFAARSTAVAEDVPYITVELDGNVTEMTTEEYVLRAMLAEGDKAQNAESKKALAVAIRSQAYYLSAYGLKHESFDACDDPSCCAALGELNKAEKDFLEECASAVRETGGIVLTNGSAPAMALVTLCSGSGTRDCADFTYLTAVKEANRCEHHVTEKSFAQEELDEFGLSAVKENSCIVYDGHGKCTFAVFGGRFVEAEALRNSLGLPSAEFILEINDGEVRAKCFGAGNGYGLNICGANRMAESGQGFEEILKYYYPELNINKIYNN